MTTTSSAHIFRPAGGGSAKGASKNFDNSLCHAATVARFEARGYALVGVFGDGLARAFTLPGLKDAGSAPCSPPLDARRLDEAIVTPTGDIIGWTGPSEMALLNVWGVGLRVQEDDDNPSTISTSTSSATAAAANAPGLTRDRLYDAAKAAPARPTISNLAWISGAQYVTAQDMDLLIAGGPDRRPPSKKQVAAERTAARQAELDRPRAGRTVPDTRSGSGGRGGSGHGHEGEQQQEEGYYAWMQRQIQERTEQLGLTGTSMESTRDASEDWSDSVSKFVSKQKRNAALGLLGSKFGL